METKKKSSKRHASNTKTKKKSSKRRVAGILPNPRWLKAHGYGELVEVMRANPEAFAHIRQAPDDEATCKNQ